MRKPTADELRKLKDKAAEAAARGRLDKAADLYREAAEGDARDVGTRQKLAEVLRRAGRMREAIQAYRDVADRFARDGLLIKAIAISKTILELDPQHVETQSALAELYAKRAAAEGTRPPARTRIVQAMKDAGAPVAEPPAAKPAPKAPSEDRLVAIPLGPAAPDPERATGFARIVFAARAAVEAGAPEDLLVAADGLEGDVAEDEPLSFAALEQEGDRTIELAPLAESPPAEDRPGKGFPGEAERPPGGAPPPLAVPAAAPAPAPAPARPAPVREGVPATPPAPRGSSPPPAATAPAAAGARRAAALPRVPIFSDLSREAFVELTRGMALLRVPEGDPVIREGDGGDSFYVVASGRFAVSRRDEGGASVVLARLGEGDFFGEMALLSGASRSATVTAEEDGEVLELRADVLLHIAGRHPHLARSLRRFYRQRLLANAMAMSPIFRPFPRGERKLIMERFRARPVASGDVAIREGSPSDGLYVVLEGAVDVVKRKDGRETIVGQLGEGDLFGETSCLRKAPATATVVVRRAGTLLRLPREDFDELVVTYPQILELVSTLSEERAENLDAILSGHAEWTDEGLVLT